MGNADSKGPIVSSPLLQGPIPDKLPAWMTEADVKQVRQDFMKTSGQLEKTRQQMLIQEEHRKREADASNRFALGAIDRATHAQGEARQMHQGNQDLFARTAKIDSEIAEIRAKTMAIDNHLAQKANEDRRGVVN